MKWFISHSSKDSIWAKSLLNILNYNDAGNSKDETYIFFSSNPEYGSDYKSDLLFNIDNNMENSDCIILIVTESYLKSQFCYYELCMASNLKRKGKTVILLVQNEDIYKRIDKLFFGSLYINANDNACVDIFINTLKKNLAVSEKMRNEIHSFFAGMSDTVVPTEIPYIGMSEKLYRNTFMFAEQHKVEKMTFGYPANIDDVVGKIKNAKEIIFVSTTGSGFLKTYKKLLSQAVSEGVDFSVVVADKNSDFAFDVSEIEVINEDGGEKLVDSNFRRIVTEFDSSIQYLNEIYAEASVISEKEPGQVKCCCGFNLIRQTAFIIRYDDNSVWGWITCTMPPERSADKTPSFVISGDSAKDSFARAVWKYCKTITKLAEKRKSVLYIKGNTEACSFTDNKKTDISMFLCESRKYWEEKRRIAIENMEARSEMFDGILIEVAAQHPLKGRCKPNAEFKKRLDMAIELFNEYSEKDVSVHFYIPGSIHKFNDISDDISLSEAGKNYLIEKGIPESIIFGDDANIQYKGDDGVYNSADECYVSSKIFFDGDFGKLICVCSPNQIMRKTMLYMEFGCVPICYSVTSEKMFHQNVVKEIFDSLNSVLYFDHSWQNKESELYSYFREERKP